MQSRFFKLLAVIFPLLAANVSFGARCPQAGDRESLEWLRMQWAKAAEDWVGSLSVCYAYPCPLPQQEHRAYYGRRRAMLDAAKTKADRLEAFEVYRDSQKTLFTQVNALHAVGAKFGEDFFWCPLKYQLLQAEIWLREEQAKP